MKTSEQGRVKAKSDIRELGYVIYRYDMPSVRTGAWSEYYGRFKHFGIKESGGSIFADLPPTVEFMNAYNIAMDESLQERYGSEYMKYRHKILPPKGVKPFLYGVR